MGGEGDGSSQRNVLAPSPDFYIYKSHSPEMFWYDGLCSPFLLCFPIAVCGVVDGDGGGGVVLDLDAGCDLLVHGSHLYTRVVPPGDR